MKNNLNDNLHTCPACNWKGSAHELEAIEDAPHRVAVGELMPLGQCPCCGTCMEVPDEYIPEYTLMACADILRKRGWLLLQPGEPLRKSA